MDKIYIKNLTLQCIIGTKPMERKKKQKVIINVVLECDLRKAGKNDRLGDTVNYKTLAKNIISEASGRKTFLIERLADKISNICLMDKGVRAVTVSVEKPSALEHAAGAAVEIRRTR